jgi:hypothetical protein
MNSFRDSTVITPRASVKRIIKLNDDVSLISAVSIVDFSFLKYSNVKLGSECSDGKSH